MNRLESALDKLFDEITHELSKPTQLAKIVKKAGIDLTKEECNDILKRATTVVRRKLADNTKHLIEETKLPEKMAELQDLTESSRRLVKETGLSRGYRPQGIEEDIKPAYKNIYESCDQVIDAEEEELDEQIEELKELIKQRQSEVEQRAGRLESEMKSRPFII